MMIDSDPRRKSAGGFYAVKWGQAKINFVPGECIY